MVTPKRIGVLMGGMSSEREISLKSGALVTQALKRRGYTAVPLDVDRRIAEVLHQEKVEAAFIALHGRYGEDGTIQGLLEVMGIPYTGSGVLASALGMDKVMTKQLLRIGGILTPPSRVLIKGDALPLPGDVDFPFPWVVKPSKQGSTIGISIVRAKDGIGKAVETAFHFDGTVLIEAFVEGQEITAGILNDQPLPPIEIVPKDDFYDYRTKTTAGMAEYRVPARLATDLTQKVQRTALEVHRIIGCRGASRVDFRVSRTGQPYVLEINTVPGMTETSLLPRAAKAAGIEYDELVERILKSAFEKEEQDAEISVPI